VTVLQFALYGLATGGIYALLGQSVVVVHRGSNVLNFAAAAIGTFGACVFYKMWDNGHGVWWPVSLLCALAAAAALGAFIYGSVMYPLRNANTINRIVATLGIFVVLIGVEDLVFAPNGLVLSVNSLLPTSELHFGQLSITEDRLLIAAIAVIVTAVVVVWSSRTRLGLAVLAVAENRTVAAAMGWSPNLVGVVSWALGSVLAAVAIILAAPLTGLNVGSLTLFVLPAMAAALVARFESYWLTLVGALVIGVGSSEVTRYVSTPGVAGAIPLLVIVGLLIVRGATLPSKAEGAASLPSVAPGRRSLPAYLWFGAAAVLIAFISVNWLSAVTVTLLVGMIVLSVVVVTGFAGQLSLAQYALAGVGAFVTVWLIVHAGLPMAWAILLGAIITGVGGVALSVPALRARGSDLAISTLALVMVIEQLLLTSPTVVTPLSVNELPTLSIFGLKFDTITHARAFGFLALVVFMLLVAVVVNIRRSALGRCMLAVRANERAAASLGISVSATKMYAFAIAAFIAGIAGGLLESQFITADFSLFSVTNSIDSLLYAVIGGLGWPSASALGAVGTQGGPVAQWLSGLTSGSSWLYVITGGAVLLVILQSPDGVLAFNIAQGRRLLAYCRRIAPRNRVREVTPAAQAVTPASAAVSTAANRTDTAELAPSPTGRTERTPGSGPILSAHEITVAFGGQLALDGVSLDLYPGEVVGLIGPNGAGKSTLIEVICGFQKPGKGEITIAGRRIDRLPPHKRTRLGLGRSFQSLELFDDISVVDNLRIAAERVGWRRYWLDPFLPRRGALPESARVAIESFRLEPVLNLRPQALDYAQRWVVAIARAIAVAPKVLFLDEPAAGLDERERRNLSGIIAETARRHGVAVLLVEHDVDLVFGVSDRVIALEAGRVIATGTPDQVRQHPAVVEAYLGAATPSQVTVHPEPSP
jgi:ABC-type branched-subunit amino acid transport system ATPase component/branched-subunit amino acid ABC-type transport system permease component